MTENVGNRVLCVQIWRGEDAPREYLALVECVESPSFVTYVPDNMRFTHTPASAAFSERLDGATVYVE
jgi:hypothetical protein